MSQIAQDIAPLTKPFDRTVRVPGSKSITNRALVCAALADGVSNLHGVLDADDTQAMLGAVESLGAKVTMVDGFDHVAVAGTGAAFEGDTRQLDVRMSGTTARFATPLAARGTGSTLIDGAPEMRARPMAETARALRLLGCTVDGDTLPLTVSGPMVGGKLDLAADVSSQFASGLLLAAPGLADGLQIELLGDVVSRPYLDMTCAVMRAFGAHVDSHDHATFHVPADSMYSPTTYQIEPDASAASYFFAAAAVTGSRVVIGGLGRDALQGDVQFVKVLEQMGATVDMTAESTTVQGPAVGELRGVEVDMADISDTAQTLAAIAPFATSPTRVTGIGFIRNKETDRVAAVVNELVRMGIDAVEEDDGFVVRPGTPQPATVETYHDHRMAMSFAITGLVAPGITIADPGCVAKTFPSYWEALSGLY